MYHSGSTNNYQNLFTEHSKSDADTQSTIRDLEARLDKLELISEALWEIVKKETNLNETDLIERITEIDLKDGKFDGKKRKINTVQCK